MPLLPVAFTLPRAGTRARAATATGKGGSCDAWSMLPEELVAAGISGSGQRVFSELQRPWRWHDDRPALAGRSFEEVGRLGAELPRIASRHPSADGSHKLSLALPADSASIEAVHMPRAVRQSRVTLCVSSQVGCALACDFCATGALGLTRHLSAGEIVAQILVSMRALGPRHPGELTLVFMGMGEALHNFNHVTQAIRVLCHPAGLGLSPRRITLSTAGLVPQIERLGALAERPLLAVSLNATTNGLRDQLMPINRRYPLETLRAALSAYPARPRERITIEYVLLAGVNDTPDDAARLADFCTAFPHHINLIPFNAHTHSQYRAPAEAALDVFARAVLARRPTVLSVRRSRASDVAGACGQLVAAERMA